MEVHIKKVSTVSKTTKREKVKTQPVIPRKHVNLLPPDATIK